MKKATLFLMATLAVTLSAPVITFAAWWNPMSWFNTNSSTTAKVTTQTTTQNSSDESSVIAQLNQTITQLEQQLKDYKCPACVQNTTQCPECKPQIITQDVPVLSTCPTQPTCPVCEVCQTCQTCPTSQTTTTTSSTPTPLTASCSIEHNTNIANDSFMASASGGSGVYYYTWSSSGTPGNSTLPNCIGSTTSPTCIPCVGGNQTQNEEENGTYSCANKSTGDFQSVTVTVSDSGGQSKTTTCPDLNLGQ